MKDKGRRFDAVFKPTGGGPWDLRSRTGSPLSATCVIPLAIAMTAELCRGRTLSCDHRAFAVDCVVLSVYLSVRDGQVAHGS